MVSGLQVNCNRWIEFKRAIDYADLAARTALADQFFATDGKVGQRCDDVAQRPTLTGAGHCACRARRFPKNGVTFNLILSKFALTT